MWDWIPEAEAKMMQAVFAMEDARKMRREAEKEAEAEEETEEAEAKKEKLELSFTESTGFPGAIYGPPGVFCGTSFHTIETDEGATSRRLRCSKCDAIRPCPCGPRDHTRPDAMEL